MGTSWNTEAIKLYAYQLGKRIARQRMFSVITEASHCLFNGFKLPTMPPLNTNHPHASIGVYEDVYYLFFYSSKQKASATGRLLSGSASANYKLNGDIWESCSVRVFYYSPIWANYDVVYADYVDGLAGTLVVAASEPVPIYE